MAHNKASLLGLPFELRWEILFLVLLENSRPAPPGPSKERFRDRRSIERVHRYTRQDIHARQDESRRVRFEAKPYPNSAASLLLTNKQLMHETVEVLLSKRFVSSPVRCRLDVVYINNGTIFPTWLSVPCREITHIDELHVQFRLFNRPDYMPENRSVAIHQTDSLREGLFATFYHLGVCILDEGPRGAGRITIGRLVMDFLPAEEGSAVLPLGPIVRHYDRTKDFFTDFDVSPELDADAPPRDPGLYAAAMMMGFVRSTMRKWREEAQRWNHPQLGKVGQVEWRLAGTTWNRKT